MLRREARCQLAPGLPSVGGAGARALRMAAPPGPDRSTPAPTHPAPTPSRPHPTPTRNDNLDGVRQRSCRSGSARAGALRTRDIVEVVRQRCCRAGLVGRDLGRQCARLVLPMAPPATAAPRAHPTPTRNDNLDVVRQRSCRSGSACAGALRTSDIVEVVRQRSCRGSVLLHRPSAPASGAGARPGDQSRGQGRVGRLGAVDHREEAECRCPAEFGSRECDARQGRRGDRR